MTELVMTDDGERALTPGRFYWVHVRLANVTSTAAWQPARFTGIAGDTAGSAWDFIGYASPEGHHHIEVLEIGAEICPPAI